MDDKPRKPAASGPHFTDRAQADLDARRAREATALRANLLRRKAQMRDRAQSTTPTPAASPEPENEA